MANSKLLKEAIADAKAVKETALANAKIALEEAFTPRLQSILSKKLREDAKENDDDTTAVDEELDSSEIGNGTEDSPKDPEGFDADTDLSVGVKKSSDAIGAELDDYEKVADLNEDETDPTDDDNLSVAQLREKLQRRLAELDGEDKTPETPETPEENPTEYGMGEDEPSDDQELDLDFGDDVDGDEDYDVTGDEDEDTEEDEMDLEAIIRELEQAVKEEGDPTTEKPDDTDGVQETLANGEEAGTDKGEDPKVVITTERKKIAERAKLLQRLKELDEPEKKDNTEEATDPTGATDGDETGSFGGDEDVIDLEEILREMEADLKGDDKDTPEKPKEESKQVKEMKKSLKEAYDTIISLRGTINEVNLLNAKLLFANKLFRAHNLTNEQKVKIIETLDRTKSVREVKLVYSTLAENLRVGSIGKTSKKSITEGMASKVVKSTKPTTPKQVISESVDFSARFKKLAGIIK